MHRQGDVEETLQDYTALPVATARALLSFVEEVPDVCRRHQFYMLLQTRLQPLLTHSVAVCGAYERQRKALMLDVFNTVPLPEQMIAALRNVESPVLRRLSEAWVGAGGEPLEIPLEGRPQALAGIDVTALRDLGIQRLLVHGVSRPARRHEISSLFLFGGPAVPAPTDARRLMRLVVHGLHAAYQRVAEVEREIGAGAAPVAVEPPHALPAPRVTVREAQILSWIREGKNNQEIGQELGISALTVKNHIQKILRKLGASNRAHALALALEQRLLDDGRRR